MKVPTEVVLIMLKAFFKIFVCLFVQANLLNGWTDFDGTFASR